MNFRKLNGNDLSDFASNLITLLGGTELSSIDSHVRADLVTAFGTLPAELAAQTADAVVADDLKRSKVAKRDETKASINVLVAQVRNQLSAGFGSKEEYELAGFDFPESRVTLYVAQDPSDLSVYGFSNGVNKGSFTGNNRGQSVTYDVWRRAGDEGAWAPHLITKRQSFIDKGVTPGQYYEYRVRALASKSESQFSNSAVVYGIL